MSRPIWPTFALCLLLLAAWLPTRAVGDEVTWAELPPTSREGWSVTLDSSRGRLLAFGGYDGQRRNDVWVYSLAGRTWSRLMPSGTPPSPRYGHSAIYDPVRDRLIIFGGHDNATGFVGDLWALDLAGTPAWSQLSPAGGSSLDRSFHAAVYDPIRDRMLVFGGAGPIGLDCMQHFSDVWALSLAGAPEWSYLVTAGSAPSGRYGHSVVFDPTDDRLLVFGGEMHCYTTTRFGDAWELRLASTPAPAWAPLSPAGTSPAPRSHHAAVFDEADDRMVVFGGAGGSETWILSLAPEIRWDQAISLDPAPPAYDSPRAVLDPVGSRMVMVGGRHGGSASDDVWSLSLAGALAWEPHAPQGRWGHTLTFDSARHRFVLFGGVGNGQLHSDTWVLTPGAAPRWDRLAPSGTSPPPRVGHTAVYDAARDRLLVFGGDDGSGALRDVWALSLADPPQWIELQPGGPAPVERRDHSAVLDPTRNRMVVFGGAGAGYLGDVWSLVLDPFPTWSQLSPEGTSPAARSGHSAIHDPAADRIIVYGGYASGSGLTSEVWSLSLSSPETWTRLAPGGPEPSRRSGHAAVHDPTANRMLIFAGNVPGPTPDDNDVWSLSLSATPTWSEFTPMGSPPRFRISTAAAFDPSCVQMIAFGGREGTSPYAALRDTWILRFGPTVAVFPSCGGVGTVFSEPGRGFTPGANVELRFFLPDGTPDLPNPIVPADDCGAFAHFYDSSNKPPGTYTYYAVDLTSGASSSTVSFEIIPPLVPSIPTGLKVTNLGSGTSLKVTWDANPASERVFLYRVYRSRDGAPATLIAQPTEAAFEDQNLERGVSYTYSVSAMNCVGASPLSGAVPGTPDYYPVLLVHGIWGSPGSFTNCVMQGNVPWQEILCSTEGDKLGDRLVRQDLRVFVARYDSLGWLESQVPTLQMAIDSVLSVTDQEKLIVVAHSQGGLISRSLLRGRADYQHKVAQLVMLGTPNHGASLARLCWLPGALIACGAVVNAAIDLNPASEFLNELNYGDDHRRDFGLHADCGKHEPEDIATQTQHWVLAGTGGHCKRASLAPPCLSDGIVAVSSAHLSSLPAGRNLRDLDLPGGSNPPLAKHYDGCIGLLCGKTKNILEHDQIATAVAEIIKTGAVTTNAPPSSVNAAPIVHSATSEAPLIPIAVVAGSLAPQVMATDSALVDATQELVVVQYGEAPLDLLLRAPSGRTIVPTDSALADVDYDVSETGLARALLVIAPETGAWVIESTNPGATSTAYRVEVLLDSSIPLQLDVRDSVGVEDRRTVLAAFGSFEQPSLNGYVTCSVMRPDSVLEDVQLYDDGAHADGAAGDGIFGGTYLPTLPGFHFVEAKGVLPGTGGGPDVHRAAWGEFVLETFKDLSVDAADIKVTRPFPPAGDSLLVSVVVRNNGVEAAPAARVRLASKGGSPGPAILVAVPAADSATVQGYWVPTNQAEDTLLVTVDANYAFTESRGDNNTALVPVSPGTVSASEARQQAEFDVLAFPNPARGTVTFRVSVPARTHVALKLYDVAGRAVATLHEGELSPGPHTFEWRRTANRGESMRSGVYFYELRVGAQRSTRRIVILK